MNLPVSRMDEIFVREYLATQGDVVTACMRAGIRLPGMSMLESAHATIKRPDIQKLIRQAKMEAKYSQPIEFTNRSIAEDLEKIFDEAMSGERPDYKAAIMAKDSQMKVLGLLVSKVEITKTVDVEHATTAELERWLRDHQRTIEGDSSRVIDVDSGEGGSGDPEPEEGGGSPL